MSFVVCRVQKYKTADVKGMQIHNQRESANSKNKDINPERSCENIELHNQGDINYNHAVKERILKGYTGEKQIRTDATVMAGLLVTSDKAFFDNLSSEERKRFFVTVYDHLAERYGRDNVIAARVHVDERTPHMHFHLVPLTAEGKLSAKTIFDRKELLALQKDLPDMLKKAGFDIERGVNGSDRKHTDTHDYKKSMQRELEEQKKQLAAYKKELEKFFDDHKYIYTYANEINEINDRASSSIFSSNISLPAADYEKLIKLAKNASIYKSQVGKLERIVEEKDEKLKSYMGNNNKYQEYKNSHLEREKLFKHYPEMKKEFAQKLKSIEQDQQNQKRYLGLGMQH